MTTPSITDEQLKLWYTQRIDPPLPAHWGMPDEVSEFVGEVLWGTLFRGDSDPFSYVDILNDSTINESDKWDCDEKHMKEFDDYAVPMPRNWGSKSAGAISLSLLKSSIVRGL